MINHNNPAMLVQPNPSDGYFRVSVKNPTSGNLNMRVYNSSGMLVNCRSCSNGSIGHEVKSEIDLSSQPNGFYILKVVGENFIKFQKLVLSR
jgi:hypothetical protein